MTPSYSLSIRGRALPDVYFYKTGEGSTWAPSDHQQSPEIQVWEQLWEHVTFALGFALCVIISQGLGPEEHSIQIEAFCSSIIFPSKFRSRDRLNFYRNLNKIKSGCLSGQSSQIDYILIRIILVYRLNRFVLYKRTKGFRV